MTLILFVCRGNTCRSPMAEVAARAAAAQAGLGARCAFASAGIAPTGIGAAADSRAVACVAAFGLDLAAHETRGVDGSRLQSADRIYALDRGVRDHLLAMAPPDVQARIRLLMDLVPALGLTDVADPWHGTAADYAHAFGLISAAVDALVAEETRGAAP